MMMAVLHSTALARKIHSEGNSAYSAHSGEIDKAGDKDTWSCRRRRPEHGADVMPLHRYGDAAVSSYFNAGIVRPETESIFLPRLVGRDKALDMPWTARVLKGEEAAHDR